MLKIITKKFAKTQICDILYTGRRNPKSTAGVVSDNGNNSQKNIFTGSKFIGACKAHFICGVAVDTISTLASSFFVPIVENRGKSINKKTLSTGGKTCKTHTQKSPFIPLLSVREVSL